METASGLSDNEVAKVNEVLMDYLFRKIYFVGSEFSTWCGKLYNVLLHHAIHLAHRTAIKVLVIAGNTLYPHCSESAVLDISSERTIHCPPLKAWYFNYPERNETITHICFLFLEAPFSLPSQLRLLLIACHLFLPKCIERFLAIPSMLIPSPVILLDFIILIGYFWQRKAIYIFPKTSKTFLGGTKSPILHKLEASSRM